mgnify:CR=1 FL=1
MDSKPPRKAIAEHAPWMPPKWETEDVGALQALQRGDAEPHQQQRALKFIIEGLAGAYDAHYFPGPEGQRNTDFALGRAFVGQQMVKLLKLNLAMFTKRRGE